MAQHQGLQEKLDVGQPAETVLEIESICAATVEFSPHALAHGGDFASQSRLITR